MMEPTPRIPFWATEGGLPSPEPHETFTAFWKRLGAADDAIQWALNMPERANDCANDRMATWLRLTRPRLFLEAIDRLAYANNIPVYQVGVTA